MSRFFKRLFLPIFLGYSLLLALGKFFFFQYGYIPAAKWMGRFLLLAQIPAFLITRPFNSLVLNKVFGFSINFTTYTAYSNFPHDEGFFNLANDLVLILLSAITYILYFFLWRLGSQKLTRKSLSVLVISLFLLSYLVAIASGLFRYWELRSEGWWKACPEITYGEYDPIPSPSSVTHYTCEWLRESASGLIIKGLVWVVGLLAFLKIRLGGRSLITFLKARWLVLAWLVLISVWILPKWYFSFSVSIMRAAIYSIPLFLPVSWLVLARDYSRRPRTYLALFALSLLSVIYALAIFATTTYRPMFL